MKIYYPLLIAIFALSFTSCKKDNPTPSPFLTAKINGVEFKANKAFTPPVAGGLRNIVGKRDNDVISLTILDDQKQTGTFTINGSDYIASFDDDLDIRSASSGTITITKYEDGIIEGSFNFHAEGEFNMNKVEITEGKFLVKYF